MFFYLPFLPYQIAEDGFVELVSVCPNENGLEFTGNVSNNYIQQNSTFPYLNFVVDMVDEKYIALNLERMS